MGEAVDLTGREIATAAGGPTTPFSLPTGALSTLFRWFADEGRLCVIAPDLAMKASVTDVGFAHALGHLGDRDLIVVFPRAGAEAISHRLPFLEVPVRCFALTEDGVEPVEPMRPADVIASYEGIRGGAYDVTVGLQLVAPLLEWLAQREGLVEDERKSYRTWQYKGRQVLTLRMEPNEAELVAGVNYSDPKPGREPVILRLTTPMTDAQRTRVQAAVDAACKARDSGQDRANAEHLLQERLRTDWKPLGLQAAPLREVPVRRPIGYGYIDLVGAGTDGRIHVIETKLGPFDRLVIQGPRLLDLGQSQRKGARRMARPAAGRGHRHRLCRSREDAGPRSDRLLHQRPGRGTARRDQVAVHHDPELEECSSTHRGAAPAAHPPHGSEGQTGATEGTPSLADSPRPSPRPPRRGGRCHTRRWRVLAEHHRRTRTGRGPRL